MTIYKSSDQNGDFEYDDETEEYKYFCCGVNCHNQVDVAGGYCDKCKQATKNANNGDGDKPKVEPVNDKPNVEPVIDKPNIPLVDIPKAEPDDNKIKVRFPLGDKPNIPLISKEETKTDTNIDNKSPYPQDHNAIFDCLACGKIIWSFNINTKDDLDLATKHVNNLKYQCDHGFLRHVNLAEILQKRYKKAIIPNPNGCFTGLAFVSSTLLDGRQKKNKEIDLKQDILDEEKNNAKTDADDKEAESKQDKKEIQNGNRGLRRTWSLIDLVQTEDLKRALSEFDEDLIKPMRYDAPLSVLGILWYGASRVGKTTVASLLLKAESVRKYYWIEKIEVDLSSHTHNEIVAAVTAAFNNARNNAIKKDKKGAIIFIDEIGGLVNSGDTRVQRFLEDALKRNMDGSDSKDKLPVILFGTCNEVYNMSKALMERFNVRICWREFNNEERKDLLKKYLETITHIKIESECYCDDVYDLISQHNYNGTDFDTLSTRTATWSKEFNKSIIHKDELIDIIRKINKNKESNINNELEFEQKHSKRSKNNEKDEGSLKEKKRRGPQPYNGKIILTPGQQKILDDYLKKWHPTFKNLIVPWVKKDGFKGLTMEEIAKKDPTVYLVYVLENAKGGDPIYRGKFGDTVKLTIDELLAGYAIKECPTNQAES